MKKNIYGLNYIYYKKNISLCRGQYLEEFNYCGIGKIEKMSHYLIL
jgi:hypothetical protein